MSEKLSYSAKFKRNYVAFFALLFFFVMICFEIAVAFSVPVYVSREHTLSVESRRREMLLTFDHTRHVCRNIPENDEILAMEKRLVLATCDHLALYLRSHAGELTEEEVNVLFSQVIGLYKIASKLSTGVSYSKENKFDTATYMNSLVRKHAADK